MQRLNRRLIALFCALIIIFSLTSAGIYCSDEKITAIVSFTDNIDTEKTLSGIKNAIRSAKIKYVYDTLFDGVALTLDKAEFYKLEALNGVESAAYALSYEQPESMSKSETSATTLASDISSKDYYDELRYDLSEEFKGEGTAVAIIDNGFYVLNQHFALTDDSTAKIGEKDVKALYDSLNGSGEYYSPKLPYVCDYRNGGANVYNRDSHGMIIAGIIGANSVDSEDSFNGVAPEAQLLLMKVFEDSAGATADEADIIAALEDAYNLGCDVINLSLGVPCGNENAEPFDAALGEALVNLEELGISVVCAGGNSGRIGSYDYYDEQYSISYPLTSTPDYGTTPTPAAVSSTTAVGALSAGYNIGICFTAPDGSKIAYTDTSAGYMKDDSGTAAGFARLFDGKKLEYVVINGVGNADDFKKAGDLKGKLALIERGELTFSEKLKNAEAAGAVGAIIYDNVDNESLVSMAIEGANIPAIFISHTDGQLLIKAKDKKITFVSGDTAKFDSSNPNLPVTFSSWGVTPGFSLKPDVSAVGSNVYSLSQGTFGLSTGTSMAAGFVSGAYALLKQYAVENELDTSPVFLKALLMNTADPASIDSGDMDDVDYSPRVQGAGRLNIESLFGCEILMTGNSGASVTLGDGLGTKFSIDLKLTNLTDEAKTVTLSSTVGGDSYVTYNGDEYEENMPYFVSGAPAAFSDASVRIGELWGNLNRYSDSCETAEVIIPASGELNLTLNVYVSKSIKKTYDKIFTEGWYIEGFIYADTGSSVSSIPYVGFVGDWDKVTCYDSTVYEDLSDSPLFDGITLWSKLTSKRFIESSVILGSNVSDGELAPMGRYIAFSPNNDGDCDYAAINLNLLRNIECAEYSIIDSYGTEVYHDTSNGAMYKSAMISSQLRSYSFKLWDGIATDNSSYVYPDGQYTVRFSFKRADSDELQTLELPLYLDTTAPKSTDAVIIGEGKNKKLAIKIEEAHHIQSAYIYDESFREKLVIHLSSDEEYAEMDDGTTILIFDIGSFTGNTLYLDLMDYAYNVVTEKIELNGLKTMPMENNVKPEELFQTVTEESDGM